MSPKHYETILQIYDKTLVISQDNSNKDKKIAHLYNHHGIEVYRPLQFDRSHKGLKNLRLWIHLIMTKQVVSRHAS